MGDKKRGRPVVIPEAWSKVTVILTERQVMRLDRLAIDVRSRAKRAISRAEIIRALIDSQSNADLLLLAIEKATGDE